MKKGFFGLATMLVMLVAIIIPIATALAQEDAPAAVPADEQVEIAESMTFGSLIKQGGWAMYPLGLFSMATLYFVIRNSMLLREKNMLREDLKPQLEELMKKRDVAGVRHLCQENQSLLTAAASP